MLKPEPSWKPLCFCIVSEWSTFALFRAILDVAELVRPQGFIALDSLLDEVMHLSMPEKGKSLKISVLIPIDENTETTKLDQTALSEKRRLATERRMSSKLFLVKNSALGGGLNQSSMRLDGASSSGGKGKPKGFLDYGEELRTFTISRPDGDYEFLDYVSFEPLFSRFSVKDIMIMFTALLRERRVLVFAQSLANVTAVTNALGALVSPFAWQHVFIPILPRQLLDFVEAPMPYVIGVLRQNKTKVFNRSIEIGTLIINADKGEFFVPPIDNPDDFLPQGPGSSLKRSLERVQQSDRQGSSFDTIIAHSFLKFWVEIFKDFQKFFKTTGEFDSERFIKSRPSAMREFMTEVVNSQMVEVYLREREELVQAKKIDSDVLVVSTLNDLRIKIDNEFSGKSLVPSTKSTFAVGPPKAVVRGPAPVTGPKRDTLSDDEGKATAPKEESKDKAPIKRERPKSTKVEGKSATKYSTMPAPTTKGTPVPAAKAPSPEPETKAPPRPSDPPKPLSVSFAPLKLDQVVDDKELLKLFTAHIQSDEAADMALTFYIELKKMGFKFEEIPFQFLQKVSFAAGITHAKGIPNAVAVIPLNDLLKAQISAGLDSGIVSKELMEDFSGHIQRLLNRKLADFKPPTPSALPSASSAPLLDDLSAAFMSKSNPNLLSNASPSPAVDATTTHAPPTSSEDKKDKDSPTKEAAPTVDPSADKSKDKKDKSFFGKMKGLTRNKTVSSAEGPAKTTSSQTEPKEKEKDKEKTRPPIPSLKGAKNRSTVDMSDLTRDPTHVSTSSSSTGSKVIKPTKSPRSSLALDGRRAVQIKDEPVIQKKPSKSFQPIASRFDIQKEKEQQIKTTSPRELFEKLQAAAAKKTIGVGKDFNGTVLQSFPKSCVTLRSGDLLVDVTVFIPLLRCRYPPIDAYKSQFGDYYAVPLGSTALLSFLDFIFSDKVSVDSITDPEDIIDLIRFCGMHTPKFRSELLNHFLEQVKVENCIKYLTIAYNLSRDPASSREISRALNYLKYFFVTNWDRVTMSIDMDVIPNELLIELIRLNSKGNGKMMDDLKRSIQVFNSDSDDDTLAHALLVLLQTQDEADYTFHIYDVSIRAHKYIVTINAPTNQFGLNDSESTIPETLMPSPEIFEILLHFIYVQDFLTISLPPIDLETAHHVWQSGMFYLGSDSVFEAKLASYFASSLNVRGIVDLLLKIEEKPYAISLKDTVFHYAAKNISVISKSPILQKLPRPTLVALIEKLA